MDYSNIISGGIGAVATLLAVWLAKVWNSRAARVNRVWSDRSKAYAVILPWVVDIKRFADGVWREPLGTVAIYSYPQMKLPAKFLDKDVKTLVETYGSEDVVEPLRELEFRWVDFSMVIEYEGGKEAFLGRLSKDEGYADMAKRACRTIAKAADSVERKIRKETGVKD
jgi:hypothetical protein